MKRILSAILAVVLVFALAACTPAGPTEGSNASGPSGTTGGTDGKKEPVTISFMHTENEEERAAVINGIVDEFMKEYDWITVDVIPVEGSDLSTKLTTMAQGNNLPEVINVSQAEAQYMAVNELVDYDAHARILERIGGKDVFLGDFIDFANDDNGLYMLPYCAWTEGVWVNKGMLQEKGFAVPKTWDDVLKIAEAFYDPTNGKYGIALATGEIAFTEQTFSLFYLSEGANVFDAQGGVTIDTPEMKKALETYQALAAYTMPGSNGTSECIDAFTAQNAPMTIFSTYIMGRVSTAGWIDNLDVIYPGASYGYVNAYTVTNQCTEAEREAAELLVEWMYRKENVVSWLHMAPGGMQPILNYVASSQEYRNNEVIATFAHLNDTLSAGMEVMEFPGTVNGKTFMAIGDVANSGAISTMAYQVAVQNVDVDTALKNCQAAVEQVVK